MKGLTCCFFKKLFKNITLNETLALVQKEPLGQYSRRIWFLYEWLMGARLPIEDLKRGNFVLLIDPKLQFASAESTNSSRHRIRNNLPGTVNFCPLIFKTKKLIKYIESDLSARNSSNLSSIHKEVLQRTSAFHMLASMKFSQLGIIFPVSAAILNRIDEYRRVLESYSHPLLDLIEWEKTSDNNVIVLHESVDYYRYFDATRQAEFLYDCVNETIERLIPEEVAYLR